jgi:hypothetical protein
MHDCRFAVMPVGAPLRVIRQHPTVPLISDALGGAVPAPIVTADGRFAAWVRETGGTEGLPRNDLAFLIMQILGRTPMTTPVLGPAVVTFVAWQTRSEHGQPLPMPLGTPEGFQPDVMDALATMAADVRLALSGADAGFSTDTMDARWATAVRTSALRSHLVPVPDDYPYNTMRPVAQLDHPWAGLARHFGSDRTYVDLPAPH